MRRAASLLAGLGAVLFAAAAVRYLVAELKAYPLVEAGIVVTRADRLPSAPAALENGLEDALAGTAGCETHLLRARVAIRVFLLQSAINDGRGIAVREARFARSQKAAAEGLACDPGNGTLWALLATLEATAAYQPARFLDLMKLSTRLAPFEGGALQARWNVIPTLPGLTSFVADSALQADLLRALGFLKPDRANAIVGRFLSADSAPLLGPLLAKLGSGRTEALLAASRKAGLKHVSQFLASLSEPQGSSGRAPRLRSGGTQR